MLMMSSSNNITGFAQDQQQSSFYSYSGAVLPTASLTSDSATQHHYQQQQQQILIPTSPNLNAQMPLAASSFVLPLNPAAENVRLLSSSYMFNPTEQGNQSLLNVPSSSQLPTGAGGLAGQHSNLNTYPQQQDFSNSNIMQDGLNISGNSAPSNSSSLRLKTNNLRSVVKLPLGTDLNHWLSIHTIDFFGITNLLYGSVTQYCTDHTCPVMGCGSKYEYHWKDASDPLYSKSSRVSAPCYVKLMMQWVERQITNDSIFPSDAVAQPIYPEDFKKQVKVIFKRLFRVYAHLYASHYTDIVALGEENHLKTSFKHFLLFAAEFGLVPQSELRPLRDLIVNMMGRDFYDKSFSPSSHQQPNAATTPADAGVSPLVTVSSTGSDSSHS